MKTYKRIWGIVLLVFMLFSVYADYVDINDFLTQTGAVLEWEPVLGSGRLVWGDRWVSFKLGTPFVLAGDRYLPADIIREKNGTLLISDATAGLIKEYFALAAEPQITPRVSVVLLDPGHGGKDPGAVGYHTVDGKQYEVREKDVVLNVAKQLKALLSVQYPDKKILLTRESDIYLSLEERTEIANAIPLNENEAIIFISIHANASFSTGAKGFEVWYLPPEYKRELGDSHHLGTDNQDITPIMASMLDAEYTIESIFLARSILRGMNASIAAQSPNRGIKEESWFVVRKSMMPSVLIEVGFVTNPQEGLKLLAEDYLQSLTQGIYNGVNDFITKFESSKGFTES